MHTVEYLYFLLKILVKMFQKLVLSKVCIASLPVE